MDFSKKQKLGDTILFSIFLIYDYLIEMNDIGIVIFFIISFIEFIQINYFFLNPLFINYWNNEVLFNGYISFIKYFWIDQIFSTTNQFNKFLIVFYFWIVLILIMYLMLIFVAFSLKNNFPINIIIKFFILLIVNIFVPVLFTPMLSAFLTVFMCPNATNYFFPDTECFRSTQIIHCVFGGIGIFLILIFGYIHSLIFFETNPKSKNIKARFNSRYEHFFFITKMVWVFCFHLTSFYQNEREWLMAVINFTASIINFFLLIKDKPYYNMKVNKILLIFRSVELITSIILLIGKLIGNNKFEGEFIMYFLGIVLIVAVIVVYPENKFKIVILNTDSIRDVDLFQRKIIYTFELIENQEKMQFELFLKGYIITNANLMNNNNSEDNAFFSNIKKKVDTIAKNPNEKCKKHVDEYLAFQKYISECYKKGLKKFPQSNSLRLNYLLFSIRYLQNPQLSMMIMKQIESATLSMEEKFIFYRYSKIVEERLIVFNPNAIKVDINYEIMYKRNKNIFLKLVEKTTYYLIEFWDVISREHVNFPIVEDLIYKINIKLETLNQIWNEIQKIKTNDNKLLLIYENFLKKVLNDEQGAEDLYSKFIDIQQSNSTNSLNSDENFLGEYETYIQDGSGYIICSGNAENFEKILAFNPSLARQFDYTIQELKTKNINILLPELFRNDHKKILLPFSINDDMKEKTSKNFGKISSVGLKKTGYIFPLNLTTTILSGMNNSINFLALIKPPPSDNFKPYPIYFLTDNNLNMRNVSSQAIQVFGINSNNICYKDKSGKIEYLNISLLIKDFENFKTDKTIIDVFKSGSGLMQKKKITLDNLKKLTEELEAITERNRSVKVIDINLSNEKANSNYPHFKRKFKDFYISLTSTKFAEKTIGYLIKLEPLYEENYLIDTKNTIVYESNIMVFNPHTFQFVSQDNNKFEFGGNKNILNDNAFRNSGYYFGRKNKNIDDDNTFLSNLVNYLFKKNNIKDYCDLQKVKTIIRVQGKPDKEILPNKIMKIDEIIKAIDNIVKTVKGKEMTALFNEEDTEEKNEEQNLLQKTTESLLNFKGIEGWNQIYSKLRKAKNPNDIIFLRYLTIFFTIAKLVFMILLFLYENSKISLFKEISIIKLNTLFHSHYVVDSITQSEKYMYFSNKQEYEANSTQQKEIILENVQTIINITNELRQIPNIDKDEYLFYVNRSFVLLSNPGIGQNVQMNLLEVFIQLINKMIGMTKAGEMRGVLENYNLFMKNANNVYILSVYEVLDNLEEILVNEVTNFENKLFLFLLIAIILIFLSILNIMHTLKISFMKNRILNLFFTIPEKICWKYYSNCELFMKYMNNYEILDIDNKTSNVVVNNQDSKKKGKKLSSFSTGNKDDDNTYFVKTKRALSSIYLNNKKVSTRAIIKMIILNLIFFIIDYTFYAFSYLNFQRKVTHIININSFSFGAFLLKTDVSLYVINQRQIYSQTDFIIMNKTNEEFQTELYISTSKIIDNYLNMWFSIGIDLFSKLNNVFQFANTEEVYDVTETINTGRCNSTLYTEICKKIPPNYQGFNYLTKSLFLNFTQIYIDYKKGMYNGKEPPGFYYEEYNNLNDILSQYFSPIVVELYTYVYYYLDKDYNSIRIIFILLVSVYLFIDITIFVVYWMMYQTKEEKDIVYAKTTLLLLHPKDVREIRYIMDYLQKEIYKLNSSD